MTTYWVNEPLVKMRIGLEKDGLVMKQLSIGGLGLGTNLDWKTSIGLKRQTWTRQIVLDMYRESWIEESLGLDTGNYIEEKGTVERAGLERVGANLLSLGNKQGTVEGLPGLAIKMDSEPKEGSIMCHKKGLDKVEWNEISENGQWGPEGI